MDADPETERAPGQVRHAQTARDLQQFERHAGDLTRVALSVRHGQAAGDHVGVAHCLHLVHVKPADRRVELAAHTRTRTGVLGRTHAHTGVLR